MLRGADVEVAVAAIAFLLLYCYLIYPGAARMWAALFGRPVRRSADYAPRLTVVVPAHNEEKHIERKIRSILDSDYPREKLKAVVVSDGSSDKTAEIARRFSDRNVVVIELKTRMGKPEAMNRALAEADGEAVVFTDASALLRRGALRALLSNLADAEVGCASAVLVPPEGAGVEGSMGLYRRYENFLRRCESRIHSSLGATGALFAVRREWVGPLRADTILDDLAIPLEVIRGG
jgi:cellulose synthase/poly-beta-1,6-N-acetylglucosamine synthase-like glycosyltransferase